MQLFSDGSGETTGQALQAGTLGTAKNSACLTGYPCLLSGPIAPSDFPFVASGLLIPGCIRALPALQPSLFAEPAELCFGGLENRRATLRIDLSPPGPGAP